MYRSEDMLLYLSNPELWAKKKEELKQPWVNALLEYTNKGILPNYVVSSFIQAIGEKEFVLAFSSKYRKGLNRSCQKLLEKKRESFLMRV
jgi:hypothetical protein